MRRLSAIDLYSGIGGWSLGLHMAGIEVLASYEWWKQANTTNQLNNRHPTFEADIRGMDLEDFPKGVDIVVGSPPCTQFSFANRGGSGNIDDGLVDIAKFLSVVEHLKPKFWAMENVPRVVGILQQELRPGNRLERFAHLSPKIQVVDMCEWGLPQRRQRCIAGNIDFNGLRSYVEQLPGRTLGDVIKALSEPVITDPIYGIQVPSGDLVDHIPEEPLSWEEERMNREMKEYHPVYNNMAFPDPLDRTSRTITATCTRVSRESVVISDPAKRGGLRRLTIRERGCLQGFPVTYQFFGESNAQKMKMVGNAIPPLFTFYVAQAMMGIDRGQLIAPGQGIKSYVPPLERPAVTCPDSAGSSYPKARRFRAAIPHLRFKSGVRFELSNASASTDTSWLVSFFYGDSKSISQLHLDKKLLSSLIEAPGLDPVLPIVRKWSAKLGKLVYSTDSSRLQAIWNHSLPGKPHPYDIVDEIGEMAEELIQSLEQMRAKSELHAYMILKGNGKTRGIEKVMRHAVPVLAGLISGSVANSVLLDPGFNVGSTELGGDP